MLATLNMEICSQICALYMRNIQLVEAQSQYLWIVSKIASKFIPSLEIDVIHRGSPGDKRQIRTIFERHPSIHTICLAKFLMRNHRTINFGT